jgi:hypothetical protein
MQGPTYDPVIWSMVGPKEGGGLHRFQIQGTMKKDFGIIGCIWMRQESQKAPEVERYGGNSRED